jgi:hypothetical protein
VNVLQVDSIVLLADVTVIHAKITCNMKVLDRKLLLRHLNGHRALSDLRLVPSNNQVLDGKRLILSQKKLKVPINNNITLKDVRAKSQAVLRNTVNAFKVGYFVQAIVNVQVAKTTKIHSKEGH